MESHNKLRKLEATGENPPPNGQSDNKSGLFEVGLCVDRGVDEKY